MHTNLVNLENLVAQCPPFRHVPPVRRLYRGGLELQQDRLDLLQWDKMDTQIIKT